MPTAVEEAHIEALSILYLRCIWRNVVGYYYVLDCLSILYLRCVDAEGAPYLVLYKRLSILYLRCAVLNAILTAFGQNAQTFNSLFEMRSWRRCVSVASRGA